MKENFTTKKNPYLGWITAFGLLFGSVFMHQNLHAQFTIKQDLKGNNISNDLITGGTPAASLTSGVEDPIDQGWLRLTKAQNNQKGFAYINKSFPSSLGVLIDFEYTSWADSRAEFGGADGFSVFLFDAQYGPGSFELGGYGGSLGYANSKRSGEPTFNGLKGGYIGVGIDEFGNYSSPSDGRNGGPGWTPNAIVLRGATTSDYSTTNKYIAGKTTGDATPVYYKTIVAKRPSASTFYRRIQLQMDPTADGKFRIQVRWATKEGGSFTTLLDTTSTTLPPKNLKVGFAASTGLGYNYHEVRNLMVTTPGGLRLDKQVNKTSAAVGEQLKYTINLNNATKSDLENLILTDTLRDANGNMLPNGSFTIDSLVFNNHNNTKNSLQSYTIDGATIKGIVNMATATTSNNAEATLTAYVTVNKYPEGGAITNAAKFEAAPGGISEDDTTNNYAVVRTKIISTDLKVTATHDDVIYQGAPSANFYLDVKNEGPDATGTSTIITDTLPEAVQYVGFEGSGWIVDANNGIITATYNGSIAAGQDFPKLTLKVKVNTDAATELNNRGAVRISTDLDSSNNFYNDIITVQTFAPGVIGQNQKINENTIPAAFTEITPGVSSSNADITHQWQISKDGQNWSNIANAIDAGYQETNSLTGTTYYRRLDNASDRNQQAVPTNVITVTADGTTLNIDLQKFEGTYSNGINKLVWVTASEQDNKGFGVYRSTDAGKSWEEVSFIAGKGTTTFSSTYNFEESVKQGVTETLYKLKIVDNSGKFTWSNKTVSLKAGANTQVSLYPNPAHDFIWISGLKNSAAAYIYDANGRQVLVKELNAGNTKIGIQQLSSGLYFIRINNYQLKFIKK